MTGQAVNEMPAPEVVVPDEERGAALLQAVRVTAVPMSVVGRSEAGGRGVGAAERVPVVLKLVPAAVWRKVRQGVVLDAEARSVVRVTKEGKAGNGEWETGETGTGAWCRCQRCGARGAGTGTCRGAGRGVAACGAGKREHG